jgi:hypothetical protein
MAKVCKHCKRPIPKNHAECPHCAADEAAALEALEEPVEATEDSAVLLGADEAVEEVTDLADAEEDVLLDEEIVGSAGDSDAEQFVHALAEEEEPVPGDSAIDLASLEPVAVEEPSSIKLADLDVAGPEPVEEEPAEAEEEAVLAEEEIGEGEEPSVVDLGSIADVNLTGAAPADSPVGSIHLAEFEEEEPAAADEMLAEEGAVPAEPVLAEEEEIALTEPASAESPSGVVDLAALGDETLAVDSGGSGLLRPDERHSVLDLAGTLAEDPAQLRSSKPSELGPLDLAAAQDEPLAVEASPSGTGLQGDLSLEDEDEDEELDFGTEHPATAAVSDLNLVSEALEPGASSSYLQDQEEAEALAGEFTEPAAEDEAPVEAEAEESEAVPDEFLAGPDIVEQVESGVDLMRGRGETVREETAAEDLPAEEEVVAEEDSAVDLGATAAFLPPEEEAAAPVSSAVDLGETEAVEQEQPAATEPDLDDLDAEAAALLGMEGAEEPARQEVADEEIDLGGEGVAEEEPAAEEEAAEEEPAEEEEKSVKPPKRRSRALALVAGLFFGLLLGAGGLYAALLYKLLDGVVPAEYLPGQASLAKQRPGPDGKGENALKPPGKEDNFETAQGHLQDGDFNQALTVFDKLPEDPNTLAARGEARWLNRLQELLAANNRDPAKVAALLKNDPEVQKAMQELTNAKTALASYWLAHIEEVSGAPLKDVRAKYEEGRKQIQGDDKGLQARFQAALDRLDLQAETKPMGGGAGRLDRGEGELRFWLALAVVGMQAGGGGANKPNPPAGGGGGANPPAGGAGGGINAPKPDEPEAGTLFWKALREAQGGEFKKAIEALDAARDLHNARRFLRLRKAQNPNSDPDEQIFLRACAEIRKRWELEGVYRTALQTLRDAGYAALADELGMQPDLAKALAVLTTTLKDVADKLNLKDDGKKALKVAVLVNSIGTKDDLAAERAKVEAVVDVLKTAKVDKFKDLDAAADFKGTKDDLAAGVTALKDARDAERAKVEAVVAELKAAGAEKFKDLKAPTDFKGTKDDLAAAVKDLGDKVQAVVGKLITAGAKKFKDLKDPADFKGTRDDLAGGVGEVTDERNQAKTELAAANTVLDEALQVLIESNHLPKTAGRKDVAKGVQALRVTADHPVVRGLAQLSSDLSGMGGKAGSELLQGIDVRTQLAALTTDNAQLRGNLANRWTPQELLPVWLKLMQTGPGEGATAMALTDVKRVTAEKPMPDAQCVQALADRNAHKFAEARGSLEKLLKDAPAAEPKPEWREVAEATLAKLTDPDPYVREIGDLRGRGKLVGALTVADEAVEVFPADGFGKANADLRALRGLVRLDLVRGANKGRLKPEQVKDVQLDAEAALAGGEAVEGNYLLGRLAEESGALGKAEDAYRAAVQAYGNGGRGQAFAKDHPVCDASGHRYRAALARVLLAQAGFGGAGPAGGLRQDRPNEGGAGGGREDRPNRDGGAGGQNPPNREGFRQEPPAGGVGGGEAAVYQAPPLLVWTGCGCASVLAMPVLLADPAAVVDVEGMGRPANPRVEEAIRLARESIKRAEAGEGAEGFEGYLILGEALGLKHKWTDGLMAYVEGLRHVCSRYAPGLTFLVSNHPAFKRLDSLELPDPLQAEAFFARGLRFYYDRRYEDAERELLDAVHYSDQDARYLYFLGLARLAQPGKRDLALEDFRQAARLEKQDKPNRLAVSAALEKVQGPARRILNEVRDRAR